VSLINIEQDESTLVDISAPEGAKKKVVLFFLKIKEQKHPNDFAIIKFPKNKENIL